MVAGQRGVVLTVAVILIYSVLASFTRPFTWPADVVTAVAMVVVGVAAAVRTRKAKRTDAVASVRLDTDRVVASGRRLLIPATVIVAVAGWELFCYLSAPRAAHPTLSTLLDLLDATRSGKAVAFALWLALGWYLVDL